MGTRCTLWPGTPIPDAVLPATQRASSVGGQGRALHAAKQHTRSAPCAPVAVSDRSGGHVCRRAGAPMHGRTSRIAMTRSG